MFTVPAVRPVTTPPDTKALELDAVQAPPALASESVEFAPMHTVDGPVIVPGGITDITLIVEVATAVPHMFVTV